MIVTLALFLAILILAGGVLIWEARTGQFASEAPQRDTWRGVLFFLATVIGGALLIRSAGGTILLALAFLPVTLLSLMRFVTLARRRWMSGLSTAMLALALLVGTFASLSLLSEPIHQGVFLEQIFHLEGGPIPDSIDPDAGRPVRL